MSMMVENDYVMTNVEQPRQVQLQPQTTVQLAHATSDAVISGLGKSPYLLGLVVLTAIGVFSAVWFLNLLIQGQAAHLKSLLEVQNRQQTEIITLHKAEFDALLEMANRLALPVPVPPSIISSPQGPQPTQPARRTP
jgi:hypothetical protein